MNLLSVYDIAVAQGIALAKDGLEKTLREQIAREIMASNVNVFMTTPETIRAHYAAIARGSEG